MALYTLLYLKWITNKDLLYITHGTLISVMWQPGWEGSLRDILSISFELTETGKKSGKLGDRDDNMDSIYYFL